MRLLVTAFFLKVLLVSAENAETQDNLEDGDYFEDEELSSMDFTSESEVNVTELQRFCLNVSEQLNATKHRGFLHGFCMMKFSLNFSYEIEYFQRSP